MLKSSVQTSFALINNANDPIAGLRLSLITPVMSSAYGKN